MYALAPVIGLNEGTSFMSTYSVYGIGNALLDMEFRLSKEEIVRLGVEKGVMTLIDSNRQKEIVSLLKRPPSKIACGGSAANTMIAVAQFGGKCFYSCKVGDDQQGDHYFKDLVGNGVDTNLSKVRTPGVTGTCYVFVTPDADRTMNTYLGITQEFSIKELDEQALKNSKWLYNEGYLVASPSAREAAGFAMKLALENGVKTSLTFSDPNMVKYFRQGLLEIIGVKGEKVDLLFCNEDEALAYARTENLEEAKEQIKQVARTFVITRGENGSYVFDGTKGFDVSVKKVDALDTVGAGDMFAGAFLSVVARGGDYHEAARLASLAGAEIVTHYGPRLESSCIASIKNEFERK